MAKKSNKGIRGIVKAAESWKNVKPQGRNRYLEAKEERDWAGVHTHTDGGTMGPGFFDRLYGKKSKKSLFDGKKGKKKKSK